jgi:hypothetical protein
LLKDCCGQAVFLAEQAEVEVLGTDVAVNQAVCLIRRVLEDTLGLVAEGKIDRG